jgi:hypothetical protein
MKVFGSDPTQGRHLQPIPSAAALAVTPVTYSTCSVVVTA